MKKLIFFFVAGILALFSCNEQNEILSTEKQITKVTMDISGLNALGDSAWYEAWVIWLEKTPSGELESYKSIGVFTVDEQGQPSQTEFDVNLGYLQGALNILLTIEPDNVPGERYTISQQQDSTVIDTIFAPSNYKLLAGKVFANTAQLHLGHKMILDYDFFQASGSYILNTPSDTTNAQKSSGIWFVKYDTTGKMISGLDLPLLPSNWSYEGLIDINGELISTGKFTDPSKKDEGNLYADTLGTPYAFPGEDFLTNAPAGFTFPLDLRGREVFINMNPPHPANCNKPFELIPFNSVIPQDAVANKVYEMQDNTDTFPNGDVSITITLFE